MGGYPRYCVQCGSELAPSTRFCGNCGRAAALPDGEPGVTSHPAADPREMHAPARVAEARPGGLPPVPPLSLAPPAPRSPAAWEDARPVRDTQPAWETHAAPAQDTGYPPAPSFTAPPSFAAPPTGPAYPPPPSLSEPPPPTAPLSRADSPSPLTGPAYPPTAPAQYALPPASSDPPPAPAPPGETAKFGTRWMDDVGFNPQWEQPPALPAISDSGPAGDRPRQRRPLVMGLFALLAAVFVVPALLIVHAFHGLGGSGAAAAQPASSKPAQSTSATPSERAAASALASLLAQSVTDRETIVSAVGAVNHCTSGLSQAPHAFQDAATSRQRLLQQLARMSGRSALPAAMLRELTGAWQASATVDEDLGKWAQDEVSNGCHHNDHTDASFVASNTPDVQATNDKNAFVAQWNPIAAKYGLTRYSTSQL